MKPAKGRNYFNKRLKEQTYQVRLTKQETRKKGIVELQKCEDDPSRTYVELLKQT